MGDLKALDSSIVTRQSLTQGRMFGRRKILLNYDRIDRKNVVEAVGKAMAVHRANAAEIDYLWNYYKGDQPVLRRVKEVRSEINNKIVINVANEVVSFKVGYQAGEPVTYISRNSEPEVMDAVMKLNDYMFAEDKASQDQEICEWQMIGGVGERLVLPDEDGDDGCPFEMYTLDPRTAFVAYSTNLGEYPLMGVKYRQTDEHEEVSVYTPDEYFLIVDGEIRQQKPHLMRQVPIIEYPANRARLGAFEIVLPLLDALNECESNRLDAVQQQVQAFLKFINCEIDKEGMQALKELGAILIKSVQGQTADVDSVKTDVDQDQTQTLKDDLYQSVLTICGMPNRNGGSSTSDTGSAVIFRDGWETAESRAKDYEHIFKRSERVMLKLVLRICNELTGSGLTLKDIDMKFTRRNYENIQSKAQVLCEMLASAKIHPKLAFAHCGLFSDPESAWDMSEKYYEEQMEKWRLEEEDEEPVNGGDAHAV